MKRIYMISCISLTVLGASVHCFASVLPRFNLSSGTQYNYDLEIVSTLDVDGDTYQSTVTGDIGRDVSDFNDTYKLITTKTSNLSYIVTRDEQTVFQDTIPDGNQAVEKMDTRGFVRGDIEAQNDFYDVMDDVFDMNNYDDMVKPFLAGLFLTQLPPNEMNVNDTWTLDYTWEVGDMNNPPTTHFRWKLLAESETHLGISCAKFEITAPNSTFNNLNGCPDVTDCPGHFDDYDITTFNVNGTLWFDVSNGKIVEWDVDIQYDGSATFDDGSETAQITIDRDASVNYKFTGTE